MDHLEIVTETERASLLADIVGHPASAPTLEELDYTNPELSTDEIQDHLETLVDAGVVEITGSQPDYYQVTDTARDLFDQNGLFPENAWKRQYQSVKKNQRIQELESMPRPDKE